MGNTVRRDHKGTIHRFESCPDYNKRLNDMKLEEQIGVFIVIGFVMILFIIGVAIFDKDKH